MSFLEKREKEHKEKLISLNVIDQAKPSVRMLSQIFRKRPMMAPHRCPTTEPPFFAPAGQNA